MKNITILNFSGRNNGNCDSVARFIQNKHSSSNIWAFMVRDHFEPCNHCNYECLQPGSACPGRESIKDVMDHVMNSDLIYYIVPNYCGYPSSNLYAFNERIVGYFNMNREMQQAYRKLEKRFIVISNTENPEFRSAAEQQSEEPQMFFLKSGKYGKRSTAGDILTSEQACAELASFLDLDA